MKTLTPADRCRAAHLRAQIAVLEARLARLCRAGEFTLEEVYEASYGLRVRRRPASAARR